MALEIGTRLGRYEILEVLESGTSGQVYRARDVNLGRQVALKVLHAEVAGDEETVARFSREARALASLSSPSVATIYGVEEAEGIRFLVLELIKGQTLKQRLRESGPLPVPQALAAGLHIAEALAASHAKGIIHRDLNPANIKLVPDGKAKLLDFGLAKSHGEPQGESLIGTVQTLRTRLGVVMGTPPYMSPELTLGQPADKLTDIWAFGCVLYEALAGKRAFGGSTVPDVWEAIQTREPNWTLLPAETPEEVQTLLRRCLDKDVQSRLPDIGEARAVLQEVLRRPAPSPEGSSDEPARVDSSPPEEAAAARAGEETAEPSSDAAKKGAEQAVAGETGSTSTAMPGKSGAMAFIIVGAILSLLAIAAVYYFVLAGK
jgi:serine/threonine protein kinase